jgi:PAS domain S-box-containing protein
MLRDKRSFEQLLQESDSPMLLLNQAGIINDINQPATTLLGGKREDYLGREIFSLVDPADRFFLREKWGNSNPGAQTVRQFTVRLRRFQGESDWHTLRIESSDEPPPATSQLVHLQHMFTPRGSG